LWQADQLQHFGNPPCDLRFALAGHLEAKADVLRHRQVREECIGLKHHADLAPVCGQSGDVASVDADGARRRRLEAADHAQHGGLATAGGPQEGHELALVDAEGEILHDAMRAEGLLQMANVEKGHGQRLAVENLEKRVKSWISPMQAQVIAKATTASAEGS
jgi:hypothetical protein